VPCSARQFRIRPFSILLMITAADPALVLVGLPLKPSRSRPFTSSSTSALAHFGAKGWPQCTLMFPKLEILDILKLQRLGSCLVRCLGVRREYQTQVLNRDVFQPAFRVSSAKAAALSAGDCASARPVGPEETSGFKVLARFLGCPSGLTALSPSDLAHQTSTALQFNGLLRSDPARQKPA
jgi:hypothetical protein